MPECALKTTEHIAKCPLGKTEYRSTTKCSFKNHQLSLLTLVVLIIFACIFIVEYQEGLYNVIESTPVNKNSEQSHNTNVDFDNSDFNYAIVIDAGSSGSRAYLYFWPEHSGNPKSLLKIDPICDKTGEPLVKAITPGLSSLSENPFSAGQYITPLLDYASQQIPHSKHSSTHLFILATAGMRLLSDDKQRSILRHLRQGIVKNYNFQFPESNLEVISGKDEGIYQWISINYVLGKLDPERKNDSDKGPRTVGAIDMGGASIQIAMEIFPDGFLESLSGPDKSQIDELDLGAVPVEEHSYKVFVSTFLGYGANEALSRHRRRLLLSQLDKPKKIKKISGLSPEDRLRDPCLPQGLDEKVSLILDQSQLSVSEGDRLKKVLKPDQPIFLTGTGDWNECYIELSKFTRSGELYLKSCKLGDNGCPDAGMKRPPIDFFGTEFYAFSEFWYTSEDVLKLGGVYVFDKFRHASQNFCQQDWSEIFQKFEAGEFPSADVGRLKTQCFKSAWVAVALHQGLAFPESYTHLIAAPNSINGRVIHWTLGALLYRTRFLPKSTIEAHLRESQTRFSNFVYDHSHFLLLTVIATIITLLLLYLKRLRRFVQPSSSLRRVPSLAFLNSGSSSASNSSGKSNKPSPQAIEGGWTLLRTYDDDNQSPYSNGRSQSPSPNGSPAKLIITTG